MPGFRRCAGVLACKRGTVNTVYSYRVFLFSACAIFGVICGLAPTAWAGDLAGDLGRDLGSIRIVEVDEAGGSVSYVPGRISLSDPNSSGQPFMAMKAGDQLILTANAGIVADQPDIAELQRRVTDRLGSAARVIAVRPEEFGLEIDIGGQEALRRPLAGGSLTEIPVQIMIPAPPDKQTLPVSARAQLKWTKETGVRQRVRTVVINDGAATASVGLASGAVAVGYAQAQRQETISESTTHRAQGGDSVTLTASFTVTP